MEKLPKVTELPFSPLPGMSSPHIQTIAATFMKPGIAPPSEFVPVPLNDGDILSCSISTPQDWKQEDSTVVMIHGLGGSDSSSYMVRIGRKLFNIGKRIVRINLRGCGAGKGLARLPYHGGISDDVLAVIHYLKNENPASDIDLIGFSLGGNIALKLAGELGESAKSLIRRTFAICSPVHLAKTIDLFSKKSNWLYHNYYLRSLLQQASQWSQNLYIASLYEFDNAITAPQWGFKDATEYYQKCSSAFYLPQIAHPCRLLFAADDPFIDYESCLSLTLPPCVDIYISSKGGHMGFLGWTGTEHQYFWLDKLIMDWLSEEI